MFYHLFQNRDKKYIYDVNSNLVSYISDELFTDLQKQHSCNELCEKEYEILLEKGFFKDYQFKQLYNPLSKRIEYLNDRNLSFFIFQVTQGCNLRCAYCPYSQSNEKIRHHKNINMTWEVAKKGLDFYFQHSVDSNFIGIGFYGGEPLLNFELVNRIVDYSNRLFEGKDIHYSITTNGTLLTDEIISFMEKNNFQLLISLDGDKDSTDKNRHFAGNDLSVFDVVLKKIKMIQEKHKLLFKKMTINMVLDPSLNMEVYEKLLDKYPFLENTNLYTVKIDDSYSDKKNIISNDFINSYNYKIFLCLLETIDNFHFEKETKLFESQKKLLKDEFNNGTRNKVAEYIEKDFITSGMCLPGMTKTFVSVNGDFYPCERVNEKLKDMIIGNVKDGYNLKNINNLMHFNRKFGNRCINCFAVRECNLCPEQFGVSGLEENEESLQVCRAQRENFVQALKDRMSYNEILSLIDGGKIYDN